MVLGSHSAQLEMTKGMKKWITISSAVLVFFGSFSVGVVVCGEVVEALLDLTEVCFLEEVVICLFGHMENNITNQIL